MKRKPSRSNKGPSTSAPMAYASPVKRSVPSMNSTGTSARVGHCEYFTNVVTSATTFEVRSYDINPGVGTVFPWLANIGARYETYKFRKLGFKFHTQSATTGTGKVAIVFDFDCKDAAPTDMFKALSYRDKASDVVWRPLDLQCDLLGGDKIPSRYTRVGIPTGVYDMKTYDVGRLHVCTEGIAAGTIGTLEVCYVVDLFTPQVQDPVGGQTVASAGLDATHLIGTQVPDPQAILPWTVTSTQVVTFNQNWEGTMVVDVVGVGLNNDWAPHIAGPAASSISQMGQVTNAAATETIGYYTVRAYDGTTLTPTATGAPITMAVYQLGSCAYISADV